MSGEIGIIEFFNENGVGSRWISSMFFYENIYPFLREVLENINKEENQNIMKQISDLNPRPHLVRKIVVSVINYLSELYEKQENEKKIKFLRENLKPFIQKDLENLKLESSSELSNFIEEFYLSPERNENTQVLAAADKNSHINQRTIYMPFYFFDETLRLSAIGNIKFLYIETNQSQPKIRTVNINSKYIKEFDKNEDRLYIYYSKENITPLIYKGKALELNSFLLEENIDFGKKPILVYIKGGTYIDNLKSFFEEVKKLNRGKIY